MTTPIARALAGASALALVAGPLATAALATTASTAPIYRWADSGKTVHATKGETFKVRLRVCSDCGDSLRFTHRPDSADVKLVRATKRSTATPPAVGGEEIETWTYRAVGDGTTRIALAEHSAEKAGKVVKRFSLTVRVTG